MSFAARLADGSFPLALEITPPQVPLPAVLLRRAHLLGDAVCAINVIQRPERQPSLEAALTLREAGLQPVWHLVTRGRSCDELDADLAIAAAGGIDTVLCIRGDHTGAETGLTIREAIARVRERLPGALLGATLNQYLPDRAAVLRNLFPKLAAGAAYVQMQPAFSLDDVISAAEAVKSRDSAIRIIAMAMPIESEADAERIAARLGLPSPPAASWAAFEQHVAALAASPLIDGLALMTVRADPPPEIAARILAALAGAGLVTPPPSAG